MTQNEITGYVGMIFEEGGAQVPNLTCVQNQEPPKYKSAKTEQPESCTVSALS